MSKTGNRKMGKWIDFSRIINSSVKSIFIIFVSAMIVRLLLYTLAAPNISKTIEKDALAYDRIGVNLAERRIFSRSPSFPYNPETMIGPTYPTFLATVYSLFGHKIRAVLLLQIFIGSVSCILLYGMGRELLSKKAAFWAGLLWAINLQSISYDNRLLTESLFSFILFISIYLLVLCFERESILLLIISGIILGIATLCRPVSLLVFLFLMPAFFLRQVKVGKKLVEYLLYSSVFLLSIGLWTLRNYRITGEISFSGGRLPGVISEVSTIVEQTDKNHISWERIIVKHPLAFFRVSSRNLINLPKVLFEYDTSILNSLGISIKADHVLEAFHNSIRDGIQAIRRMNPIKKVVLTYESIYLGLVTLFAIWGFYRIVKYHNLRAVSILAGVIISFILIYGFSGAKTPRYRMPMMPYVLLLSSVEISVFSEWIVSKAKQILCI